MASPLRYREHSTKLVRYVWALAAIWTMVVAMSSAWNVFEIKKRFTQIALNQAKQAYLKDIYFRRWNAMHGSVYVPVTEATPPNQYLKNIRERDIRTPSGKLLTLINPAYMTRQVFELMEKDHGILGHITSLKPIRPQNGPDPWEAKALMLFEQGATEASSVEKIEGKTYLRHMQPLVTEKACLGCHASQGYREGDVRGGISVSIPLEPLKAAEKGDMMRLVRIHVLFWLVGLAGLALGAYLFFRSEIERRQMKEELQASEEKFRSIFENAVEGIFQSSPEGHFISVNPAMASIHGYESPEEMVESITNIGEQFYVNREDRTLYKSILERQGKTNDFEAQVRKKDGTVIWTSLNSHVVRDASGKILYFEGIVQDITERKRAEERLLTYSREVADLYNNAPCGYHSLGPDGTCLNINDTELKWLGYERDEVVGKEKLSDFLAPESLKAFRNNVPVFTKQGWIRDVEYDLVRKDGAIFPVLLNSTAIKDTEGNFIMDRTTIFDMTSLKRAKDELRHLNDTLEQRVEVRTEEMKKARRVALSMMQDAEKERERVKQTMDKLRESAEQLKVLSNAVEQSPASVVITERNGTIEYINPKFQQLTGYTSEETLGNTPRILKSGIHGEEFYKNLWATILSGKEWHGEICNKKKNGELYWEQTSVSAVQNESGEISYFISVREDISERKRLDEELKQHVEEMERFSRLTIDRELRMVELKEEINALMEQMGKEEKYKIVE